MQNLPDATTSVLDTRAPVFLSPTALFSDPMLPKATQLQRRQVPTASLMLAVFAATVSAETPAAVTEPEIQAELAWTSDLRSAAEASETARRVQRRARLRYALSSSIADQFVEDGWTHPAQAVLEEHLAHHGVEALEDVVWVFEKLDNYRRAALMKCLGRLEWPVAVDRRMLDLAVRSLASKDLELRDATVCALERWESQEALAVLRSHRDPVPWLAAYVAQVLREVGPSVS